ncbi:hypothetical protein [Mucilaginibacter kameinonensis]|uniref:hypothetical protein n=1 Tax=Mucilaginibacter kameinonensis TaxID=452286 RepID=UPI000EF77B67|nr:hypothetical protein [Mucilaginibacter kameinonensis]
MKIFSLLLLAGSLFMVCSANAQTKTVTVDANDVLNNNTKIVAQTSSGQVFFTGHQIGTGYYYPAGIFRAITDNNNNAANYYFDGITNGTTNFSVRADGQGYFAGNLGIGNSNPDAKLTVYSPIPLGGVAKNAVLVSSIGGTSGTNYFKNNLWLVRNSAGSDWVTARLHDGISIDVSFLNPQTNTRTWWERDPNQDVQSWGTSANTYMTIVQGNVGIGITNPANKLDVNGTIHSKSVLIDLNGWADYVFKPTYQLRPLTEVKTFIDQHKHLPEIPSEQEIVKDGLNLGEMNKLLMKKIEELTLYLIEKDKVEKEQKKINQNYATQIETLTQHLELLTNQLNAFKSQTSNK